MKLNRNRLYLESVITVFFMIIIIGCITHGSPIRAFVNVTDNNSSDPGGQINDTINDTLVNDPVYGELNYRLVYIRDNIDTAANLAKVQSVMVRAKNAGYNGIVFSNANCEQLGIMSDNYLKNLAAMKNTADELGLAMYPTVLTVGYANAMLLQDPNQVEGMPVKDALFVVHDGQANIVADPTVSLPGGSFDSASNNRFYGWDGQDRPGVSTFADSSTKHSGTYSLMIKAAGGVNRVYKTVDVSPYRQYHLTLWIKTQGVTNTQAVGPYVEGKDGRELQFTRLPISSTQDWQKYDVVFNSLNNEYVNISLGTWYNTGGTVWIDDVSLEEIGLTNVIRRDECPLVVKGEDGTVYTEGVDYETVSDPLLGNSPSRGSFDAYHTSPSIVLTPNSSIREGERLRVSFYHAITTDSGTVAISMTSPGAQAIFKDQINDVNNALDPDGYFLNYDEIRVGNWEAHATPMTEGQLLAQSIQSSNDLVKSVNAHAKVFVWNDMFDPYHNAVNDYYLCNGTVDGSYNGLPKNMIVVNWNYNKSEYKNSLNFWAAQGNPMVLAGYYDGASLPIKQWLNAADDSGVKVAGVMYTTWKYNYTDLEKFANDAWGTT